MVLVTKTGSAALEARQSRGESFRALELGGTDIGARIEELPPGGTSSEHHWHSAEEEHVFVVSGHAVLVLDAEEIALSEGDHVAFPASEGVAHHLENRSDAPCRYLVYGERKTHDIISYPKHDVLFLKGLGRKLVRDQPLGVSDDDDA